MSTDGVEATGSPLQFATKAETVYGEIRRRILNGILKPSAPLNQEALAPELGVSVTPVREAIRRLEAEGLVQFQAHKLAIITPLTHRELSEIYDVRLQLDPYAASLATQAANDDDLNEVERLAEAPSRTNTLEQVRLNHSFHRAIYMHSGNGTLTEILDRLWERTDRYRVMLLTLDAELRAATREHIEIAQAMRSRQPGLVGALVQAHVARAQALMTDALQS
jgi:DNA-binding GntR family transcriptional regulator